MIKLAILVVLIVGAVVGTFIFIRNNRNKVEKVNRAIDELKK